MVFDNPDSKVDLNQVVMHNTPPPEDSKAFNDRLAKEYGSLEGFPRYRVIWGMDERYKTWQSGRMRLRYVCAIQKIIRETSYVIMDTLRRQQRKLTPKQFLQYLPKKHEVIVPVTHTDFKEIGFPFWYLEYYANPMMLGTREQWEAHRWVEGSPYDAEGMTGRIDLTGPYPENGRYEPLVELSGEDANGEQTEYRPLNDATFEFIGAMLKGNKVALEEARNYQKNAWKQAEEEFNEGFDKDVRDGVQAKPLIFDLGN